MPELPEIKRFSYIINSNGRGKSFKAPLLSLPAPFASGFRVHAIARGKELRLTMWPETNPSNKMWLLVTHGLVGRWRWNTDGSDNKGVQLRFPATDGSGELQFVDVQRMGKWTLMTEERWGKDRGADPVDEFALFKQNILDNRNKSVFSQPIGALMLDQKYFNGVGNYLRAETAFAVFQNEVTRDKILQLCRLIPMEVLERGLNKYGTPSEVEQFEAWMRCYGKAKSSKDSSGRMIWFFEDQPKHEEPLPQVSEEAYQRMFPKGDEQPTSSTTAPATSFSFATAPPAAGAISFSAPLVVQVGNMHTILGPPPKSVTAAPAKSSTTASPAKSSTAAAPSTGSIADSLYEQSWRSRLAGEFTQPYWTSLMQFLAAEKARGAQVFPPENQVFNALNLCPFENVRVVILGQDPYHDDGQAHGLSFSVPPGVPPPPSLKNIYKELQSDIGGRSPWATHGTLTAWAQRGVLLLNACLTVEAHKANSHAGKGWEEFTDAVIRLVSSQRTGVVFILWGGFAQKKGKAIDRSKHCILEGAHPSPLSVTKFLGCKHFSKANEYLTQHGQMPIDWTLPSSATEQVKMAPTATVPSAAPSLTPTPTKTAAAPQQQSNMWKCMCCEIDNSPLSNVCSSCLVPKAGTPSPFANRVSTQFGATQFGATQSGAKPATPSATGLASGAAPVPKGGFSTTTTAVASPSATATAVPSATDELVPAAEAVSRMGRMLLLLSTLHKSGHLSLEQKNQLKDLAIARDKLVFSALEAFAADEDRDLLEVADTFRRISKLRQR